MVSQATEIMEFIETNWSLVGNLSKAPLDNMKEIVRFFDREQVEGNEWPKAIVVRKINDDQKEDRTVHPNFIELIDKYDITIYYRVVDVQFTSYSDALDNIEQMGTELQRILDLQFNPATSVGPWFTANYYWLAHDHKDQAQPDLQRTLRLRLAQVTGIDNQVYTGFDGTLVFDNTDSVGDLLPASDFTYESLGDVSISEGFTQIPYLTKDTRASRGGAGVPYLGRGAFAGTFSAITFGQQDNLQGTTLDKIPNIYLPQSNAPQIGQQGTAVFLSNNNNPAGSILTTKSFVKISNIEKITGAAELVKYRITGQLVKPSETTFA